MKRSSGNLSFAAALLAAACAAFGAAPSSARPSAAAGESAPRPPADDRASATRPARAAMTIYAVQGAVGRDGAAGCRAPSDDSPAAPDVATPEGRSALAARLGGTDVVELGAIVAEFDVKPKRRDGFGVVAGRRIVFGLATKIGKDGARSAQLALQERTAARPLAVERLALEGRKPAWVVREVPGAAGTCVAVRLAMQDEDAPTTVATAGVVAPDDKDVVPPRLLEMTPPVYPRSLARELRDVKVGMAVVVDAEGRCRFGALEKTPPRNEDAAMAALDSAAAARFAPAAKNGRPVPMRWTIFVTYARD